LGGRTSIPISAPMIYPNPPISNKSTMKDNEVSYPTLGTFSKLV
jgi:hypothetical protein